MSHIVFEQVGRSFSRGGETFEALANVDLEVRDREFVAVVGPSGCGKTTLMRLVAGLEFPSRGTVRVDDKEIVGPGPNRAVVFQAFALFPWKTVSENIAFGLRCKGVGAEERAERIAHYLDLMGLKGYDKAYPHQLSGGMQQRVAIARSYALDPDVLLMDEPFGALDAQTRVIMQEELIRLTRANPRTVLFITHAVEEAVYLADRVVIMTRRPGSIKEIIDVRPVREAEGWERLEHIEEVMDQPSFVRLRSHIWRLLRESNAEAATARGGMTKGHGDDVERVDVLVVGAGFAGLYAIVRLRGLGLNVQCVEAGSDVGGTWFWNCYPGARCDIESLEYSYSFDERLQQEWRWPERYSAQPEILRYIRHVADRFDLRRSIRLNTRVVAAAFDESGGRWRVQTDQGRTIDTRFVVMATGCLSSARVPVVQGAERFVGEQLHTGCWPQESVDFRGRRVGVIGTGSSGIQVITALAGQAAALHVFQRTPGFSLPSRNTPLDPEVERRVKADYASMRRRARESASGNAAYPVPTQSAFDVDADERHRIYEQHYGAGRVSIGRAFNDLLVDAAANETAATFVRGKIASTVHDPATAAALMPSHPIGTKRVCLDSGYYEAFNRPDVHLVDLSEEPIDCITEQGIRTRLREIELDVIVYATGYDAMTGALDAIDIRGRDGQTLREAWRAGPRTLLGVQSAGFPNLFFVTGPGSPSVLSNVIVCIEQHVDWIADALAHLGDRGLDSMEASAAAQDSWVDHVNEVAAKTLYPVANSWYIGANVPGKPRVFMPYVGGVGSFRAICDRTAANGYEGFFLDRTEVSTSAEPSGATGANAPAGRESTLT